MKNLGWEEIHNQVGLRVWKTKVPAGWLVMAIVSGAAFDEGEKHVGLTFVPDPNHEWK